MTARARLEDEEWVDTLDVEECRRGVTSGPLLKKSKKRSKEEERYLNPICRIHGIHPNRTLLPGKLYGVRSLFSKADLKKLGIAQRRVLVGAFKFKIVDNKEICASLYRAVSHAIYENECRFEQVQRDILSRIKKRWAKFYPFFSIACYVKLNMPYAITKADMDANYLLYKDFSLTRTKSTVALELYIAAVIYDFTFTLFDLYGGDREIYSINCNPHLKAGKVHYYFLRSELPADYRCWSYEFLIPIGSINNISVGRYPVKFRRTIVINEKRIHSTFTRKQRVLWPKVPYERLTKLSFSLHHRDFLLRSTHTEDLWSILSELMYKCLKYTELVKTRVREKVRSVAYAYHVSSARKRTKINGRPDFNHKDFHFLKNKPDLEDCGDLIDLNSAAATFGFSYLVIGADKHLNFFWQEYEYHLENNCDKKRRWYPFFVFYVRLYNRGSPRNTHWCVLHETSGQQNEYRRLYGGLTREKLKSWNNKIYFRPPPPYSDDVVNQPDSMKSSLGRSSIKKPVPVTTVLYQQPSRKEKGNLRKVDQKLQGEMEGFVTKYGKKFEPRKLAPSDSNCNIKNRRNRLSSWIPFWNHRRVPSIPSFKSLTSSIGPNQSFTAMWEALNVAMFYTNKILTIPSQVIRKFRAATQVTFPRPQVFPCENFVPEEYVP